MKNIHTNSFFYTQIPNYKKNAMQKYIKWYLNYNIHNITINYFLGRPAVFLPEVNCFSLLDLFCRSGWVYAKHNIKKYMNR